MLFRSELPPVKKEVMDLVEPERFLVWVGRSFDLAFGLAAGADMVGIDCG